MLNNISVESQNGLFTILGSILGATLSLIYHRSKLKKEQKVRFEDVLGEKIAKALLNIRDFELQLREYEMINFNSLSRKHELNSGTKSVYPSIFHSKEKLFEFQNELGRVIRENESFLDKKSVAFILAMQEYLGVLMVNASVKNNKELQSLGVELYNDFQRWQKDFDAHIVKKLNKSEVKVTTLKGFWWDTIRQKTIDKYVTKSNLMNLTEPQ